VVKINARHCRELKPVASIHRKSVNYAFNKEENHNQSVFNNRCYHYTYWAYRMSITIRRTTLNYLQMFESDRVIDISRYGF
jgi:hypothetical protein